MVQPPLIFCMMQITYLRNTWPCPPKNTSVSLQECSKTKICLCSSQTPTCWTCELWPCVRHHTLVEVSEESDSHSHLFLCGRLIGSHPALVNAIILVLHSVAGSMPSQSSGSSSRNVSASSYSDMPGGQGRWRCCYRNVQNQKKEIDF